MQSSAEIYRQDFETNAAFRWGWELVITTSPVEFSIPHKSEVVNTTQKLVHLQPDRVSDFWRKWRTLCE